MVYNSILLQAGQAGQVGPQYQFWLMILVMMVIFWFFMIRPQAKKQKELKKFREGLKKGDKIVTIGGIYGKIVEVKDTTALIQIDDNVKIKVDKASLVRDFSDSDAIAQK
ncbi:MAG: preprotein translocase subunit YajC [Bacteroidota bacterium]|nr:preprotein translocase subunit YajC [Bacteroidota bacterium]